MALRIGDRLGPYEIVAPVGAGGMGEVYRARDTRLDRLVAIKVMAHSQNDPESRSRFEREARAISRLSHQNICTLHDVGSQDGVDFLVMEFVEGATLAALLAKGPLALDQVFTYAIDICAALDTAHRQGIVHRDLKPANVMVTKAGLKLLDFGLAKLRVSGEGDDGVTLPQPLSGPGMLLGTLPYMSPEQLEGKDVDARTDIFAFGAVVYEMLTGRRAFAASSQASLISSIMTADPTPAGTLQPLTPAALERVVRKCLEKDPDRRWQTARDLADEIRWVEAERGEKSSGSPARAPAARRWAPWTAAAIAALAAVTFAGLLWRRPPAVTGDQLRFMLPLPTPTSTRALEIRSEVTTSLALSPDGRYLAAAAVTDGRSRLWLRRLDATDFTLLPGTEGAFSPFWSPDSRFIGFGAEGKLKRVEVSGGAPRVICDCGFEGTPTWNQFGTILIADDLVTNRGIMSVSADGGTPVSINAPGPTAGVIALNWPHFLPNGRQYLYSAFELSTSGAQNRRIRVGSLDAEAAPARVVEGLQSRAEYAGPGYLLFANDGTLLAQRFDLESLRLAGEPVVVAEGLRVFKPTGAARFTTSQSGLVAFETAVNYSPSLAWFDRFGRQLATTTMPGPIKSMRLSPDGQRIAADVVDPRTGVSDIWIQDVDRGAPRRFTYTATDEVNPTWSADGTRIVFRSDRAGPPDIHEKALEGAGDQEVLLAAPGVQHPLDVSADGRLVYLEEDRVTRADLWMLSLKGDRKPMPLLRTPFEERDAVFSPDGRVLAFESDESGAPEIYVMPIDAVGSRRRVSRSGGQTPRWRQDGRELFYLTPAGGVMRVAMALSPALEVGAEQQLFVVSGRAANDVFDVSPDGQRFLINTSPTEDPTPITVILNWIAARH